MSKLTLRVHNGADVIDSRDVIERLSELEDELRTAYDVSSEAELDIPEFNAWLEGIRDSEDSAEEYLVLRALAEEGENASSEWRHGETLIRDTYFEDYARELAEDIGAIGKDNQWPTTCIDWEEAADQLKQDYTSIDFDGVMYWIRS